MKRVFLCSFPSGSLLLPGFEKPYIYYIANDCWDRSEFDEQMESLGILAACEVDD
jgi:hypothetical protein